MSKLIVSDADVSAVEQWLHRHKQLAHIRLRKRGNMLILESGPEGDSLPHARLRRVALRLWTLEMPHGSRWEPTLFSEPEKEKLLDILLNSFGWMLTPHE